MILDTLIPLLGVLFTHRKTLASKFLSPTLNEIFSQLLTKSLNNSVEQFNKVLQLIQSYILLSKNEARNVGPFQVIVDVSAILLDDNAHSII